MISIVIPVYNEKESLEAFYHELKKEINSLEPLHEIIFVDDGSTDTSLDILKQLAKKDKTIHIFSFRKNQGKAEALTLGFQKAKGEQILTLDADLQDKPSEIYKLIEAKKELGADIISGWRKNRKDMSNMIVISRLFNFITGKLFGVYLHDYNCGFKLYTAESAKSLRLYGGLHRFIPLLAYQQGFTIDEVVIEHEKRKYGKSKYGFSKVFKDIPDMFTMLFLAKYRKQPLHFFGLVGGICIVVGFVMFGYLTMLHFMGEAIGRRPLLLISIFLMLGGLQLFFTGFLAELMISLSYKEKMHFPLKYTTEEIK